MYFHYLVIFLLIGISRLCYFQQNRRFTMNTRKLVIWSRYNALFLQLKCRQQRQKLTRNSSGYVQCVIVQDTRSVHVQREGCNCFVNSLYSTVRLKCFKVIACRNKNEFLQTVMSPNRKAVYGLRVILRFLSRP